MEEMERLLALWVDDMCSRDDSPMTNMAIQDKVLSIYEDLVALGNAGAGPSGAAAPPSFTASRGWLERFKTRNNLHLVTQSGEAASSDKAAAQAYLPVLKKIIADGGYTAQQVFNVDETGLYWKRMPKRTVNLRKKRKHQVTKPPRTECHCWLVVMQRVILN